MNDSPEEGFYYKTANVTFSNGTSTNVSDVTVYSNFVKIGKECYSWAKITSVTP